MITTTIPVRFVDCDGMGHVNHAVYYTYLKKENGKFSAGSRRSWVLMIFM